MKHCTLQGEPGDVIAGEKLKTDINESSAVATPISPTQTTETRKVAVESDDGTYAATGEIVSSQTISSKTRTVETITVRNVFAQKAHSTLRKIVSYNVMQF